jgi:hypothetical protein
MADSVTAPAPPADGAAFHFQGKDFFLPRLIQADRKAFRLWCGVAAMNEVADMEPLVKSGDLTSERFQNLYSVTQGRITGGYYWWDEPGGVFWRGTTEGFVQLCLICFRRHDPKVKEDEVRAMASTVNPKTNRSILDDQYASANADPTAPRRSAAGGGETATDGSNGDTV